MLNPALRPEPQKNIEKMQENTERDLTSYSKIAM